MARCCARALARTHTLISQELDANGNVVATFQTLTVTVSEPASVAGKVPEIKLPAAGLKADTPADVGRDRHTGNNGSGL